MCDYRWFLSYFHFLSVVSINLGFMDDPSVTSLPFGGNSSFGALVVYFAVLLNRRWCSRGQGYSLSVLIEFDVLLSLISGGGFYVHPVSTFGSMRNLGAAFTHFLLDFNSVCRVVICAC